MTREIKFRAWLFNKIIKPMSIQKMIHQKKNNIPLKILENECVFMQYTGLKDKNGVDIYEGDIVRLGEYYRTKEENNIGQIKWTKYQYSMESNNFSLLLAKTEYIEVIGNIYENKELLND